MISSRSFSLRRFFAACMAPLVVPAIVYAHCDGLDGPVVTAARHALDTSNINLALIWVQPADEAEIRQVFAHCLAVRALGPEAQELADRFFFETLVRVHRSGEGAPFSGLKPAGRDLGPAIPAADRALKTGELGPVAELLGSTVHEGLKQRFHDVLVAQKYRPDDVTAGRRFVATYVAYIHFVERLYADASHRSEGHFTEAESSAPVHTHSD